MKPNITALFFSVILICLINLVPALAGTVQYTYDSLDRLTKAEATDSSMVITYTYDEVGNRLSITAQGIGLDTPEVKDTGLFSLDNTMLEIDVTIYGEQYGNLGYEYAIGTSPGATDVIEWTSFEVEPDGTAILEGLNLPHNQEYFVAVRLKNFADDVVTGVGSTDGITVLDPVADPDEDGANNESEIMAGSNPFNPDSYPALTTVYLQPGFNLIAVPAEVAYVSDLKDWLQFMGDSSDIEKVMVYDDGAGEFITLIPEDPLSESFMLEGGEGLIVYAKADTQIVFASVLRATYDLKQGFNCAGIACPQDGYTAFQLLNDLGSENVSSIQRYSPDDGTFETAAFRDDGQLAGIDFAILPGEGYFIFMRQQVWDFRF